MGLWFSNVFIWHNLLLTLFILILNVFFICPVGALQVGFCVTLMFPSFLSMSLLSGIIAHFRFILYFPFLALVSFPHFHHFFWIITISRSSQWTDLGNTCLYIMAYFPHEPLHAHQIHITP